MQQTNFPLIRNRRAPVYKFLGSSKLENRLEVTKGVKKKMHVNAVSYDSSLIRLVNKKAMFKIYLLMTFRPNEKDFAFNKMSTSDVVPLILVTYLCFFSTQFIRCTDRRLIEVSSRRHRPNNVCGHEPDANRRILNK